MRKSNLFKIIAFTLLILTILYSPVCSFIQGQQAYASATLTAVALKALAILIPLVATYVAYNWYGADYTDSQLASVNSMITKAQSTFIDLIPTFALLAFAQVYNNIKNIASNVSELAHDIGVYSQSTISKAEALSSTMISKVQSGESFTATDFVSTGILGAILYYYAKIFQSNSTVVSDTQYRIESSPFTANNPYIINFNNKFNNNLVSLLMPSEYSAFTSINYESSYNRTKIMQVYTDSINDRQLYIKYYLNNNGNPYNLNTYNDIVMSVEISFGTVFNNSNSCSFRFSNYSTSIDIKNDIVTYIINGLFGNSNVYKKTIEERNNMINYLVNSNSLTIFELLNIGNLFKTSTIIKNPNKSLTFVTPTGLDLQGICNNGVMEKNFPADREEVNIDTNITTNVDANTGDTTIGITGTNTRDKDGNPLVVDPAIPTSWPDIDNPATPNAEDPTGNLENPSSILDWLKAFWKWLVSALSFTWLKDLLSNLVNSLKDMTTTTIDWGKFKGFFDIFIILIFLILIVVKIFLKLLGAAASLLGVAASNTFFNQYPNILVGIEYLKNINVPGVNQPLITVLTYMFGVFFFIYLLKIIQSIYHAFTRQEDLEIRDAEREVRANNRVVDQSERYERRKQRNMNHAKTRSTITNPMAENDNSTF